MDGECLKSDSDFLPNKCGRRVDGGVDRISELPDEILFVILVFLRLREAAATTVLSSRWLDLWKHIPNLKFDLKFDRISQLPNQIIVAVLSFLSLKEAAATSVLSSRWSDLWKYTPNLNFKSLDPPNAGIDLFDNDDDVRRCKYIELVNSVIQSHKALSLKRFRINMRLRKSDKCAVTKWLEFVFSRRVESLELDFVSNEVDKCVLEELLRESRVCLQPQTDLIFFQSLKSLFLQWLIVSGEDIKLFLCNCPLLEKLTMYSSTLTSDVEVCGSTLVLKHLDIHGCRGERSIKVSAPNLTRMRITDRAGKLLFVNAPKLVVADFEIARSDSVAKLFPSSASSYFSQLQILGLKLWQVKLPVILANGFPIMPNLKELAIISYETYNHSLLPVVTSLIWASPCLEEFKLMYRDDDEYQPAYMQVITNDGRSQHQHLKVFELWMSRGQSVSDHTVELVTYISNNCVALRKIMIDRHFAPEHDVPADRDYLTQRLQGKVPNHIQLELFNPLI